MIKIGVVGYGYWGPNIVRNFNKLDDSQVVVVCDLNPKALQGLQRLYPATRVTTDVREVMNAPDVDAVAVVTPVHTHYEIAREALKNGKHAFVEKPLTSTVQQAEELIELAERKNLVLMVDHTFLFTGAVRKMKELIDRGELGPLYYYDSQRVNLGLFQHDVNVVWDLAPHDLSILDHLVNEKPEAVVATGETHLNGLEDIAYLTVYHPNNVIAHINVNWLSPVKVRTTLIGGQRKMLVWNDLDADEKIKVYDKGIEVNSQEGRYQLLVSYRSGDMWAPKVESVEALEVEARYFVDCVNQASKPFNDGVAGWRIVRLLASAQKSIEARGKLVYL